MISKALFFKLECRFRLFQIFCKRDVEWEFEKEISFFPCLLALSFNSTIKKSPPGEDIKDLFHDIVEETPPRVSLTFWMLLRIVVFFLICFVLWISKAQGAV